MHKAPCRLSFIADRYILMAGVNSPQQPMSGMLFVDIPWLPSEVPPISINLYEFQIEKGWL